MASAAANWNAENARGRAQADELLARMRADENPTILGHEIHRMLQAGRFEGFEVGFIHRIAEAAIG